MTYRALGDILLRAPLLPAKALRDPTAWLRRSPLAKLALTLASPSLAAQPDGEKSQAALDRYARRAAFRPTPHGLWAGVMMGALGSRTRIATGSDPRPSLHLTWARAADIARALLDDPPVRAAARVRICPSALRTADSVHWLAMAEPTAEERSAALTPELQRLLAATGAWTPWPDALAAAEGFAADAAGDADLDDLLLTLLDSGLLLSDLAPPLLGPTPLDWLLDRLANIPAAAAVRATLLRAQEKLGAGDLPSARAAISEAAARDPDGPPPDIHAVLLHQPAALPQLARTAVERAAGLAPLLFQLQDALAFPASERLAEPAVGQALSGVVELYGAGALELSGLHTGDYGISLRGDDGDDSGDAHEAAPAEPPPPALLTLLLDRLAQAQAAGAEQLDLGSHELRAALGDGGLEPPATAELFLTPCETAAGAPPGTGWLLGLHAPAGASWGRFGHALGAPLAAALHALADQEKKVFPDSLRANLAFVPAPSLAELGAQPPLRLHTLAITDWPPLDAFALTPADLQLCADPAAAAPLALRHRVTGEAVVPLPLGRIRSTTAPAGIHRLLVGFNLYRQHAPWAFSWGPLGELADLPRVAIDGFVVSPASWRVPPELGASTETPRARRAAQQAFARWRRQPGLPRWVQVGQEDQLLPVDLDRADAARDLAGAQRVWEIWPPLGRLSDSDGRRVEAVVALYQHPDRQRHSDLLAAAQATRQMGDVPPPRAAPAAPGWTTFKLFGASLHQDHLLAQLIAPLIEQALLAREIDAWFFLRYAEGVRPHLRLRTHSHSDAGSALLVARLTAALRGPLAAGLVTIVETGPYHPERARLGDPLAVAAAHRIFESDSALACTLLSEAQAVPRTVRLAASFDVLAAGLGLDRARRRALAADRRRALHADELPTGDDVNVDAAFRAQSRNLRALLGPQSEIGAAPSPFTDHRRRVAAACAELPGEARQQLLPTLLHLAAVRLCGLSRADEAVATVFWERTLEGLLRSPPRPTPPGRT